MTSLRFSMCEVLLFFPFEKKLLANKKALKDKKKTNVFPIQHNQLLIFFACLLVENKNNPWHHLDYSIVLVR